ncbi:hypothetical protein CBG50_07010 [Fusobacterium polymorphum]|jgi:hypothetical protein|uniref:Uncharacterized protein n=2 Tax=Fusobacterium nucleatum subsp. polymorphum TaxID=76857 RepID=A0A1Z3CIF8_FUSNP|nr:hypothetical protein [Fusobacterium polymorphum]ASC03070.1 hypothetical protein CBG50_07010 [Fusobacterium polymorphum]
MNEFNEFLMRKMNEFNEFLMKIDGIYEIFDILFLLLIFLFFMLLFKDAILTINENDEDSIFGKFIWVLIILGFFILMRVYIALKI